ncbi:hypothetical protein EV189_1996 [Motilibacter rhizosphaerae]|uniref:Uncharacterized protein n=1 Tax=Motilibacter rhizosphaerae TaxID=598652 RepID=A0A4Q7NUW3_9ACTN|nr:hypothetical protein [Motilibacter rhizosphaerae]RZS90212.1 hypothetical protein EV189_1996 [Motilibacter rhizosphaerae]
MTLRVVLVLGGPRLARGPLLEALQGVAAAGARADVVSWRALDDELRAAIAATGGAVVLPGTAAPLAPPRPPGGSLPALPAAAGRVQAALGWRWRRLRKRLTMSGAVPSGATSLPARLLARATGQVVPPSIGFARTAGSSPEARALLALADVAVAVDRDAALTVWRLARRRPDVTAVSGVAALARVPLGPVQPGP